MQPSFAAVREHYLEELLEHEWYDVRTFGRKQRQEMTAPGYLVELFQGGHVTAVEMHSHTPRSDGLIEPDRIVECRQETGWRAVGPGIERQIERERLG